MFQFLLPKKIRQPARSGPPGRRAYAIGDVHGRLDLLQDLLAQLEQDNADRPCAKTYLVLLGDLIDRGPDSRGVIDLFLTDPPRWATTVHLKGNHEEYFLEVLEGAPGRVRDWLNYGGYECAESYGLPAAWTAYATPEEIASRLSRAVPTSHRAFIEEMSDTFRFGDYLFVHAGLRPGVPLNDQSPRDLRLIREEFLDDRTDHGVMVVHGHTIVNQPEVHSNRIALDTGAYKTGCLSAIWIDGTERGFIEAKA